MTFSQGIMLGIIGSLITIVGWTIAFRIHYHNIKKIKENKIKKEFDKIIPH
jgi:hypothetical protein|tara:strand:+ start:4753 stop:4905 length:153 start_codon:yes stop_codon:yes gene_type:complete